MSAGELSIIEVVRGLTHRFYPRAHVAYKNESHMPVPEINFMSQRPQEARLDLRAPPSGTTGNVCKNSTLPSILATFLG